MADTDTSTHEAGPSQFASFDPLIDIPWSTDFPDELDPPTVDDQLVSYEYLRRTAHDHAFGLISETLELETDEIEGLPEDTKRFYSALVEAVATCAVGQSSGQVSFLNVEGALDLYDRADELVDADATVFLQEFAKDATQNQPRFKAEARAEGRDMEAGEFYAKAITDFTNRLQGQPGLQPRQVNRRK